MPPTAHKSLVFKTWISDLQTAQGVINNIKNTSAIVDGATGLLNGSSLTALSSSVKGLTLEQAKLALSTKNLTSEQMNQVLVDAGLKASNDKISMSLLAQTLQNTALSTETKELILSKLGLAASTDTCTASQLTEALAMQGVVGAEAEAIISSLGLAASNASATVSFNLLTASIWANIQALVAWLISNPVGQCILGIAAAAVTIYGTIKAIDALTTTYDEHKEKLKELNQSYEEAQNEVKELEGKLTEVSKKIEDIQSKGKISLTDEEELGKLEKETKELEYQLKLAKEKEKIEGKKQEKEAVDTYNSTFDSKYKKVKREGASLSNGQKIYYETAAQVTVSEELRYAMDAYSKASEKYNVAKSKQDKLILKGIDSGKEWDDLQDELDKYQEEMDETDSHIVSLNEDIDAIDGSIVNATKEGEECAKSIDNDKKAWSKFNDKINNVTTAFNDLSEAEKKEYVTRKLVEKGYDEKSAKNAVNKLSDDELASFNANFSDFDNQISKQNNEKAKDNKQGSKDNGNLNNLQKNSFEKKPFQLSLDFKVDRSDLDQTFTDTKDNVKTTQEDIENAIHDTIQTAKNTSDKISNTTKTFDSIWDSIGTTGNDDAKKKAEEEKERLKELAEAGKLTEKELKSSFLADEFTEAGVSIEEATKKINKFADEVKQLSALRTGIKSITSAYDEKKNSKKKVVSASTLDSMGDTLGVSDWGEKNQKVWENYKNVAADGKKSLADLKKAQDELATSYVNSNNFLANLDETNQDYYKGLLTEMGITNADSIVTAKLAEQKGIAEMKTHDLSKMTGEEINKLIEERGETDNARIAMRKFALEKVFANGKGLDTESDILQLRRLVSATGVATTALSEYYRYKNGKDMGTGGGIDPVKQEEILRKNAEKEVKKAERKLDKLSKLDTTTSKGDTSNDKGKDKGSKKDKSNKDSKQTFDWMERRFKNLQNVIDFTASKLQNLFSVKAKNSNLNKQIKTTTKLINEYGIAAKKYQQKADQVAAASTKTVKGKNGKKKKVKTKALSKDIIKKIQTGKLTKKTKLSSLITEYGQSTAERIQSYIDYYDKAQDAKKNKQDQKAKKRELEIQKWQNKQEDADNKISRYEAERENAPLVKKNDWIKSQIDETKKSYKAQIEIAKLERDTVTEAKLRAEKQKALNDLYQEEIDNIKANADAKINALETGIVDQNGKRKSYGQQYYMNQVSLTEARGAIVDKQWYRMQSKIEEDKIKEAQIERNQLIAKLGNFAEGTQEWYNLQSDIADCENVINDARIAQIENTKAMRSVTEAMEEKYDQWYSNFNSELSFLSSLQSGDHADSDTGTFTDSGNLALYTHVLTFKSANAEKDYWRDQTTALKGLIDKKASIEEIKSAGFEFESLEDAEKALDDYYQKWQEAISTEKSAEEAIVDLMKEKYEAQKNYLQDIIDEKKKALEIEKDLYDYSKNIASKTKNVATLQKQINALRGDTSEEGRARLAKLQVSLDEAQQDLKDTEYERFISSQQNMLDNMMKQYDDLLTRLLKETDKILADGFNYVGDNIKSLSSLLSTTAETYDYTMTSGLSTVNTSLGTGATTIGSHIDTSGKTAEEIRDAIKGMKGDDPSSVVGLLQSLPGKIIEEYKNKDSGTKDNNGGGDKGGSGGTPNGSNSYDANVDTSTAIGQYGVIGGLHTDKNNTKTTSDKKALIAGAVNDLKGMGTSNYWVKKADPTSKTNQTIKDLNKNDSSYKGKVLTDRGAYALYNSLITKGVLTGYKQNTTNKKGKDSVKINTVWKALNSAFTNAGFSTGGIAHLVKSNGEDGLMMARNGEGFVSPEHVESIQKLLSVIPDMTKFTSELSNIPKIQPKNQTETNQNISIDSINLELPNVKDYRSFREEMKADIGSQRFFAQCTHDVMKKGKITSNIQRY